MGMRILVVDDSLVMRKMIGEVLQEDNHEILGEAKNGMDAVEMYKSLRPDLVTMDIAMREMNGLEAAREILAHDPSALIVFLTNLEKDKFSGEAMRLGAKSYLSKHDPEKFLNVIRQLTVPNQSKSA